MKCSSCGTETEFHHDEWECIHGLRDRIDALEDRMVLIAKSLPDTADQDFKVKHARPDPQAGQVWRDHLGNKGIVVEIRQDCARLVMLRCGSQWWVADFPEGYCYVCDGAVPAGEVRP